MDKSLESTQYSVNVEDTALSGLTGIPQSIPCTATQITCEADNELDRIQIAHFLDTLAEVALNIATRELTDKQDEERNS